MASRAIAANFMQQQRMLASCMGFRSSFATAVTLPGPRRTEEGGPRDENVQWVQNIQDFLKDHTGASHLFSEDQFQKTQQALEEVKKSNYSQESLFNLEQRMYMARIDDENANRVMKDSTDVDLYDNLAFRYTPKLHNESSDASATARMQHRMSEAASSAKQAAESAKETVADKTEQAKQAAAETAESAKDSTRKAEERADSTASEASEKAKGMFDTAKEKAQQAKDTVMDKAQQAKEAVVGK
eukprot:scaffold139938_cov38-Prasinocladus_malaysianus.AAC.3